MRNSMTLALSALLATAPALADPPARAPAHGYYKSKPARHHQGTSGAVYVSDFGSRPAAATATRSARSSAA